MRADEELRGDFGVRFAIGGQLRDLLRLPCRWLAAAPGVIGETPNPTPQTLGGGAPKGSAGAPDGARRKHAMERPRVGSPDVYRLMARSPARLRGIRRRRWLAHGYLRSLRSNGASPLPLPERMRASRAVPRSRSGGDASAASARSVSPHECWFCGEGRPLAKRGRTATNTQCPGDAILPSRRSRRECAKGDDR